MGLNSFFLGVMSLLTPVPFVFLILSLVLLPRFSQNFREHVLKMILISIGGIILFFLSLFIFGSTENIYVSGTIQMALLSLMICLLLWLINSFQTLSSYKMSKNVDIAAGWVAVFMLATNLISSIYLCLGPSFYMYIYFEEFEAKVFWIEFISFTAGYMIPLMAILSLSWIVFGRNRDKKWVSIVQGIATVVAVILFLRSIVTSLA